MPRVGDMFPSRFFKEADLQSPLLLTIKKWSQEELGKGSDKETKVALSFAEHTKELTLNKTNATRIEKALGTDDLDGWIGKKIVVYWDPDVDYMGEITGGVRVRAPKNATPEVKKAEEDLPF